METHLNNSEERLFDLIESKSWDELTAEELAFVLPRISQAEYALQRSIMAEAETLYGEAMPLPLAIPVQRKSFIQRSIPLYQALVAVAAVILLFLLLRPSQTAETIMLPGKTETISQQAKTEKEYIHDTVVRYVTVAGKSSEILVDTVRKFMAFPQEEKQPKLLEATTNLSVPELTTEKLETRGTSMKEDNTAHLAPRIVNTVY